MPTPPITINATLGDLFGKPQPGASLTVQLANYGSQVPRVAATEIIAATRPQKLTADSTGLVSFTPWGNDVIQPAGTYYTVTIADAAGNVIQTNGYAFTGAGALDLSSLAPINPAPIIPLPVTPQFVRLAYAQNMVLETTAPGIVTFAVLLTGDVLSSAFPTTIPGQLVALLLEQDQAAGHAFAFAPAFKNPQQPATFANAKTFQAYMTADDGNLYPFGPISITV